MIIKCERHDASFFGGGGVYHRNQSWPRISQNLGCVSPKTLFWNVENCNAMVVMLQLGTFPSESNFKSSVVCHLQHNTTPLTSSNLKLNFTWKWRWTELSQYIHLLTFEMYCETISGCGRLIQYYTFLPLCCFFCLFVSLCLTRIWAARNKLPRSSSSSSSSSSSWPKYWHCWLVGIIWDASYHQSHRNIGKYCAISEYDNCKVFQHTHFKW